MKLRVPDSFDLALEPQLAPLVHLEIAAVLAINALRARHVQILDDPPSGEFVEGGVVHDLVHRCQRVLSALWIYRTDVLDGLEPDKLDNDEE